MKGWFSCVALLVALAAAIVFCEAGDSPRWSGPAAMNQPRIAPSRGPKRSKTVYALTPSMRVGRSGPATWDINPEALKNVRDFLMGRFSEGGDRPYAFRDFPQPERGYFQHQKRDQENGGGNSNNMNTGMWFGPRLGRVQKRESLQAADAPWAYVLLGTEGPSPRQVDYTPRLGRESEENAEEGGEVLPERSSD